MALVIAYGGGIVAPSHLCAPPASKYVKAHKALGDIHYRKREYASAMAEYDKAIAAVKG